MSKQKITTDHYRNVPEDLRKRQPVPKFGLNNPQLTATIAPSGFSAFVPGSFINPPVKKKSDNLMSKLFKKFAKFFSKFKLKFAYIFIALFTLAGLAYFAFYYQPIQVMIQATNKLATSDFSTEAQLEWARAVSEFRYITPPKQLHGAEEGEFSRSLMSYVNSYKKFNEQNHLKLPSIEILDAKETQVDIDEPLYTEDDKLLLDVEYKHLGRDFTFEKYMSCRIKVDNTESEEINFLIAKVTITQGETKIKGTVNLENTIAQLNERLTLLKEQLKAKNSNELEKFLIGTDLSQIKSLIELDPELHKTSALKMFGNITSGTSKTTMADVIYIGTVDTTYDTKKVLGQLEIYYNTKNREYLFDGLFNLIPKLPNQQTNQTSNNSQINTDADVIMLSCTDCWLAPVDKTHQLASKYAPQVVSTGLNGGGMMVVQSASALKELFAAAEGQGIKPRVISSYRSYGDQVNTFNYWTQKVIAQNPGISKAEAEIKANVFSARPGQSEHQLGTTVDLKCAACGDFDNSAGNLELYNFLENNAHKYGFAISYAKDTQQYTGYKYEPWHIRYIGVELATALYNTGYLNSNGNYLAKFLLEKNLY